MRISVLTYIVLTALAILLQHLHLPVSFGLSFSLGPIILLLLMRWYNLKWGSLALLGYLIYEHFSQNLPIPLALAGLEIVFLGIVMRMSKRSIVLWDAVYWMVVGVPIYYYAFDAYMMNFPSERLVLTASAAVNGLFNTLAADLILTYIPVWPGMKSKQARETSLSLERLFFHFAITSVLFSFVIFILVSNLRYEDKVQQEVRTLMKSTGDVIASELYRWGPDDLQMLQLHSTLAEARLKELITHTTLSINQDMEIFILDDENRLIMSNSGSFPLRMPIEWSSIGQFRMLRNPSDSMQLWMPRSDLYYMPTSRWHTSSYLSQQSMGDRHIQIVLRVPILNYQQELFQMNAGNLLILIALSLSGMLGAILFGRKLTASLMKLRVVTTGLPSTIEKGLPIEWPESRMEEIQTLTSNFQGMGREFQRMILRYRKTNEELRRSEDQLQKLALYDMLTGLPNRRYFHDYAIGAMKRAKQGNHIVGFLFLDLDAFKHVNDTLGHDAGDALLCDVARRLQECAGDSHFVARLGGDEFVFVVPNTSESEVNRILERISEKMIAPLQLEHAAVSPKVSIGVHLFRGHDEDQLDHIMRKADMAMYAAKAVSGTAYRFSLESESAKGEE